MAYPTLLDLRTLVYVATREDGSGSGWPALTRSFDVSPDGKEVLFDRYRASSDVVLSDLAR